LVAIVVLTATVIGLCAACLLVARSLYIDRARLRVAPLHLDRYRSANEGLVGTKSPLIVFFGDSRIEGWSPIPSFAGYEIVMRGIAGETTAQMIPRFEADVLQLKPAMVVIQAGINDLVAASILPEGDRIVEDTITNLKWFATSARDAGIAPIIMTIVRPATPPIWRLPVWSSSIYTTVSQVNVQIRALSDVGARILDADALLVGEGKALPSRFAADTLHLRPEAYQVLNERLEVLIKGSSTALPCKSSLAHYQHSAVSSEC
jgi:lysophospholipase L1-like esterase